MTALDENRAQLTKLQARMKEYQEQVKEEPDPQRRAALKAKISGYRAAIRDVQVQIDHLDPPAVRKARKEQRKRLNIGALNFDFFERSGTCWSDIEGHSWQQVEAGDFVISCNCSSVTKGSFFIGMLLLFKISYSRPLLCLFCYCSLRAR